MINASNSPLPPQPETTILPHQKLNSQYSFLSFKSNKRNNGELKQLPKQRVFRYYKPLIFDDRFNDCIRY